MRRLKSILIGVAMICAVGTAFANDASDHDLQMTCSVSDTDEQLAPNAPIWLDLRVKNASDKDFDGLYSNGVDYGAVAIATAADQKPNGSIMRRIGYAGIWQHFSIGPGKQRSFSILLNDFATCTTPSSSSMTIYLPLRASHGDWLTLTARLDIVIGKPLETDGPRELASEISFHLKSSNAETRLHAIESAKALPDRLAVSILAPVLESSGFGSYIVQILGDRKHTPVIIAFLSNAARSQDADVSSLANRYLSQK